MKIGKGKRRRWSYQPKDVPMALRPPVQRIMRKKVIHWESQKKGTIRRTWRVDNSGGWAVSDVVAAVLTVVARP